MRTSKPDSLPPFDWWQVVSAIFEAVPDSVFIADERGRIQMVNNAATDNFGFDEQELLGQNLSILMPEHDAGHHNRYMDNYCRTGRAQVIGIGREAMGRRKDGSIFPIHLSVSEFSMGGSRYFVGIGHDISEKVAMTKRLHHMATRDSLTGCLNRREFIRELTAQMQGYTDDKSSIAILFIDLDGFKPVNDCHGHAVGDQVLAAVAERFRGCLKEADLLGRVGGDEFAVAIRLDGNEGPSQHLAHRLQEALHSPFLIDELSLSVGASVGISLFPDHGDDADLLVNDADMAMYRGKREAPGSIHAFTEAMRDEMSDVYRMRGRLIKAIEQEQLELHYQLQFDLASLELCGMEALVRWRDEGKLVSPGVFLPVAMRYGLMPAITEWVIRRASHDNASLIADGILDVPVAVNVGADSFLEPEFVSQLVALTGDLPSNRLEVEITEDVAMHNESAVRLNASKLRQAGISLAMDDFGTGYSSLGRLRTLHFDKLKIDKAFVAALPEGAPLITAIVAIAQSLDIKVVAEGVETMAQMELLRELGCDIGQGYTLARPMPLAEVRRLMAGDEEEVQL